MQFSGFIRSVKGVSKKLLHKRNIIIVSEHQTTHYAISGRVQLLCVTALTACVGLSSYMTGGYMAQQTVLEQKDETIKSVANSRIETNFQYLGPSLQAQNLAPVSKSYAAPDLTDPSYNMAAIDQDKLVARIAMLETRVRELKDKNQQIIQTVRERTHGKIADLEDVIRKTGLDPKQMQKTFQKSADNSGLAPRVKALGGPQGGPFIPDDVTQSAALPEDIFAPLDQMMALSRLVDTLPLSSPVGNANTQSLFGRRIDPFTGRLAFHAGLDLTGPAGAKVMATNAGRITAAGYSGAYGNMVDIDHGNGLSTRYGHLSSVSVRPGQPVNKGQVIGIQGSTGRSTGAHVHYEVRYRDQPIDPANFLKAGAYVSQN